MISRFRRLDGDLQAVVALVGLGVLVTVLPLPDFLRALVFIPVVLLVPGYALAAALFPPRTVSAAERLALVPALSVAVWAIGGVLLWLLFDLDRGLWLLLLVLACLPCVAVAQGRREADGDPRERSGQPPLGRPDRALIAVGVILAGFALALASHGQSEQQSRAHFTGAWIASPAAPPAERLISVGVQNHEEGPFDYRLVVSTQGRAIAEWRIHLEHGETWSNSVPAAEAEGAVVASLYHDGTLWRRLKLEYGATT